MASFYKHRKSWEVAYDGRLDGKPKGTRSYLTGIKTRRLAEQAKTAKGTEEQLLKVGQLQVQPHARRMREAGGRSIDALVGEFEKSIVARGKKPRHAQQQAAHVRRLMKLARIQTIHDIQASPIQAAARSLIDDDKLSPRTANAAIKAARQFSSWLYRPACYTNTDLLHRALGIYNEEVDTRRPRREPAADEFERLVAAAQAGRRRCGITGADRAMLFQVAVGTGFRQAACLSLSKSSFRVAAELTRPSVILGAAYNKNGKEREQPIRRDLAAVLRQWLVGKPDAGKLWRPPPHASLELLVKRDLEAARKAWIAEAPDARDRSRREESSFLRYRDHAGRYFDFHALRHMGISLAVRGAGLKAAQVWADHSTPVLTAKYAHMDLADEGRVLDALPPTLPARQPAQTPETTGKNRVQPESRKIG